MHLLAIFRALGLLLLLFCSVYIPPLLLALFAESREQVAPFLVALAATGACGLLLSSCKFCMGTQTLDDLDRHDGFLLAALCWVIPSVFAALPFMASPDTALGLTDAMFESLSGLTTTGATILTGVEHLPRSLLLYRQLLQWVGGIGLVIAAVALLPLLGIGGMQIYRAQTPGNLGNNKLKPRVVGTTRLILYFYCGCTLTCALSYWLGGMSFFDAICHSFSTVSIGGFSTRNDGFAHFMDEPVILGVAMLFMIVAGMNYNLHFDVAKRGIRGVTRYFTDPECRVYLLFLLIAVTLCASALGYQLSEQDRSIRIWQGAFNAVSIVTTTGFLSSDLNYWPAFLPPMLIIFAFSGACAGSAGGGVKIVRLLLLFKDAMRELYALTHPQAVVFTKLRGRSVPEQVLRSVGNFFVLYMVTFTGLLALLLAIDLDLATSLYAVTATLNNLGPGLGDVSYGYGGIPDTAKWVLSTSMLLGRLELTALLVLLTPGFWRR